MKKSREVIIKFVAFLAVSILFVSAAAYSWMFLSCFSAAKKVPDYDRYPMVRIEFYGSGIDSVSARFSLFDTSGREFSVIERSWSGETLGIDFVTSSFGGKTFSFPLKVYPKGSDSGERQGGTNLVWYYLDHRRNMFLGFPCTDAQKKALYTLTAFALVQSRRFESRFSRIVKIDLSSCEKGHTYDIISDSRGLLTLTEM